MPKSAVFSVTVTDNNEIELIEEDLADNQLLNHETLLSIKHEPDETDIKLVPNGDGIMTIKIPDETLKYSCNQCGKNYKNFGVRSIEIIIITYNIRHYILNYVTVI